MADDKEEALRLLDPRCACVVDWWHAQNRLPIDGPPVLRRLRRATYQFWDGPWAEEAFNAGWTDLQLFGFAFADQPAPGFEHCGSLGLVPHLALGIFQAILAIEGDIARVLYAPKLLGPAQPTTFLFDRNSMDWSQARLWWRCNWETSSEAGNGF